MEIMLKETLFWFHVAFIVLAVSLGFFVSFPIMLALFVAHRAHKKILGGCLLSKLQYRLQVLSPDVTFLQEAGARIFGAALSPKDCIRLDRCLAGFPVVISLVRSFL